MNKKFLLKVNILNILFLIAIIFILSIIITFVFCILKLLNYISWNWIWVFFPMYIDGLIIIGLSIFAFILNKISIEVKTND